MFKTAQIKCTQTAVCADGNKDICGSRQPCDVVHLPIVSDELRDCRRGVDVPYSTSCIDGRGNHQTGRLLIPGEIGQGSTR